MTEGEIELAEEELLALEQDSKVREEKAALRAAVKELTELKESKEQETQELYETLEKKKKHCAKTPKSRWGFRRKT